MNWFGSLSKAVASVAVVLSLGVSSASAAADTYDIDKGHSAVMFRIQHMKAGYQYGRFNDFAGTIVFDEANPAASSVKVEVKTTSVDTNDAKRDDHLRNPDFLDCAQFPTMTFSSTAVKAAGTGYEVAGNLTLHGVTKPVTVTMTKTGAAADPWGGFRIGFEGVLTVKRSEYGMDKKLDGVGDEVRMILAFEGVKKK